MPHHSNPQCPARPRFLSFWPWFCLAHLTLWSGVANAQTVAQSELLRCSAITHDSSERLACYDRLALRSRAATASGSEATDKPASATLAPTAEVAPAAGTLSVETARSCGHAASELSRYWELEPDSDCGTFGIRGYRPLSLSWIGSDSVNTAPRSPAAGHTAGFRPFSTSETRIQLSVRTKIASGLLTQDRSSGRDSLWFGYTQQSYWQLFNNTLSRPFRSTDHEPEVTYVYPTDAQLPGGWRLRYSGISALHQSNGQSLPLSRSWNRVVLMTGLEKPGLFTLQARAWARLPERGADDDNPDISDHIGRAELAGAWHIGREDTLGLTLRHSLRSSARGSLRLEWLHKLGASQTAAVASGLRFHTQLFSGYGDSLLDYNRRRTVLSLGLSLVDF